jgi:hypothetical protein
MSNQIPGVPEGWELVRIDRPAKGDWFIDLAGRPREYPYEVNGGGVFPIIRKIEKPAAYRPFKDAEEYVANRREGFAVDWNIKDKSPGFYAVVSANTSFLWVAFGDKNKRFTWDEAFGELIFRHADNSTSPFGVEVTS